MNALTRLFDADTNPPVKLLPRAEHVQICYSPFPYDPSRDDIPSTIPADPHFACISVPMTVERVCMLRSMETDRRRGAAG